MNRIEKIMCDHQTEVEAIEPSRHPYKGYRYLVLRTAFHDGGVVSRHRTLQGAARMIARMTSGIECTCGCVGIWDRERQGRPHQYAANGEHYWDLCS